MQYRDSIHSLALLMVTALTFTMTAAAEDWPQYAGPDRNAISSETGLAHTWPESGPKVLWQHDLGEGFGGPAIRDGKVYMLDRVPNTKDIMRCYDLASGEVLWEYGYDAPGEVSHNGSRATPLVTETHVYSVGMTGIFQCIDLETHESAWTIDLASAYPTSSLNWGYAQSPIAYGDNVIVAPQSDDGFVAAFNMKTGDPVWESESLGNPGYSSPVVAKLAGVDQVVMICSGRPGSVSGLSVETGEKLWHYDGWKCRIPIPYAQPVEGDRLFITGEYGAGSAMIKVVKSGDGFDVEEVYTTNDLESQIHQPIIVGDHLYANSNGNSRNDGLVCMSLDGEVKWKTSDISRRLTFERGGLIMADGLIINLDGRTGTLHLIEPSPEGYREIAQAEVLGGQKVWAPMAISDGKLVLRSQSEIKCLDLRNP